MKKLSAILLTSVIFISALGSVSAAPFKAAGKNPQVVAYYEEGSHGIVGENEYHEGQDLVMRTGKNGNFQQWFYGTSASDGLHGDHSVWKVSKDGTCPDGWDFVAHPNPDWGTYLKEGVDYCVHTNDFHPSK